MFLVLLGGVFAGLTIALMGQEDLTLKVTATSGEGKEAKNAAKVLKLLEGRKHWVLVTLLLGNVITNETLPIVLDRSLGGGWPAVVSSTALIVVFGEIIPQSLCVRYGLPIGATFAPVVWTLMWLLGIVAWPIGKLLDYLLGEDQGTVYKKAGLKTLVTLHKTLGTSPNDRLNQDEVTIITAVLDLKEKSVGSIMTPMADVFTMSSDTILDEKAMDIILSAGYSRIPIHTPGNRQNFVGMLLVKILITYDPEDAQRVSDFALATLPETRPETSCLDIVNFFQEGKSHMVLVSSYPGEDRGALGVVTLEDVIEELIGEEIIDESDVFVDVHKAIRRLAPAPKARVPKGKVIADQSNGTVAEEADLIDMGPDPPPHPQPRRASKGSITEFGSPKKTFNLRRSSSTTGAAPMAYNSTEVREHLRHLGPSNLASRPKTTRYNTVKIKPGPSVPDDQNTSSSPQPPQSATTTPVHYSDTDTLSGGVGAGLLASAGREARDGVQAVQSGYGSMDNSSSVVSSSPLETTSKDRAVQTSSALIAPLAAIADEHSPETMKRTGSHSTIASLYSRESKSPSGRARRLGARSGSITENIIDSGGVRKVILETTSSSDDPEESQMEQIDGPSSRPESTATSSTNSKSKKRRKKKGAKKRAVDQEETPLLKSEGQK
ncbi:MAG: hypothetical protein M1814_004530 [Vezdaea aestivalis]|nr:MAG: hypothetical protein M1814_004530 [Vezdaea aestivalis]